MYVLIKAVCLPKTLNADWIEPNLVTTPVHVIFKNYLSIFLEVTLQSNTVYIHLDQLRSEYSTYPNTLNELFTLIGNRSLQTVNKLPNAITKRVSYSDATLAKYKVELTIAGINIPNNYPRTSLRDLKIYRNSLTFNNELLHTHCLLSVNGYFHMTDTDGKYTYIYDGGLTNSVSNNNHVGILSFADIGRLYKERITESMIFSQIPNDPLKNKIVLSPTLPLTGRSFFLVLGGYLVLPSEGLLWQSADQQITLDITKLPYLERIQESLLYLNLNHLNLPTLLSNPNAVTAETLYSDNVLRKYLTLSQSYIVTVDTPALFFNRQYLKNSNLPGTFTSYKEPKLPLIVGYGKAAEYWKTYDDHQYHVAVSDSFMRNYIFSQQPVNVDYNLTDHLLPSEPFAHSQGYLLDIISHP